MATAAGDPGRARDGEKDPERAEPGDDDGDLLPAPLAPRERGDDGGHEARVEDEPVGGGLRERPAGAVAVRAHGRVRDVVGDDERVGADRLEERGEPEIAAERDHHAEQDPAITRLAERLRGHEEEHEPEQAQPVEQREPDRLVLPRVRDQRRADRVDGDEGEQAVDRPCLQRVGRPDPLAQERRGDRRADQEAVERDRDAQSPQWPENAPTARPMLSGQAGRAESAMPTTASAGERGGGLLEDVNPSRALARGEGGHGGDERSRRRAELPGPPARDLAAPGSSGGS